MTLTWRVRPTDEAVVARLRDELHVRRLTATVLAARGLDDPAVAARFLSPLSCAWSISSIWNPME